MKRSKTVIFFKKALKLIGPGFITGASDDDPSGIGTYSQTGAMYGLKQLWTSLYSLPFMIVIQEMCGRVGLVTGTGIASVIKTHFGKKILYPIVLLLLIANTINVGADLGAMASSAQMIFGLPFMLWLVIMTIITVVLIVFVPYRLYVKYLKFLCITLLGYIVTVIVVKQDWSAVLKNSLIPTIILDKDYMMNIVALLGTTISPYLFFWQANEEVEDEDAMKTVGAPVLIEKVPNKKHIKMMRMDTIVGMTFSNIINFFVIDATAITLGAHGMHNIQTATDAAAALKPFAGDFAYILFGLGIMGTGLLAVPVLAASAGYAIAETFNWKASLSLKYFQAPGFYLVIAIISLSGIAIQFLTIAPFKWLYYTAIINGVAAPPIMVILLIICNRKKIMGNYINPPLANVMGIFITAVMAGAAVAMFIYM